MGDEGVIGEHRSGRHDLGAGNDDAGVGLLLHVTANVADFVRRPVAVDRRMDDGVIDEGHALLAEFVPALGVLAVRIVELGVGAQRRQEGRLVVGRTAEPAVGELRPFRDGVAPGQEIVERFRRLEECVRLAAVAGIGRHHDLVGMLGIAQRVVEPRHHARGVAERRMGGHVLHALAVDEDRAIIAERVEVFVAGLRRGDARLCGGLSGRLRSLRSNAHGAHPLLFDYRTFVRYSTFCERYAGDRG